LLLSCFAVCFCLDSIEPHLFCVSIPTHWFITPITFWTPPDAAPSNSIEASAEKQHDPGSKRDPNSVSYRSRAARNTVHSRFGDVKDGDIKNESSESNSSTESRYAAAEASHGHFTDVSK